MDTSLKVVNHFAELIQQRANFSKPVGLVPTMGNLHQGHLSLIETSIKKNAHTIVSIYVNPKQFGPSEDFNKYPRTLEEDLNKIEMLISKIGRSPEEVLIFAPTSLEQMFGPDKEMTIKIPLHELDKKLCGKSRPGHFDGVVTVVKKIFDLAKPNTAYFGEKDFQQVLIIERLVEHFSLPIKIERMPIIRDEKGLALSSRNKFILDSEAERRFVLKNSLERLSMLAKQNAGFQKLMVEREVIMENDSNWDYLEILDSRDLKDLRPNSKSLVIAGAYRTEKTRLIDNCLVNLE